MESENNNSLPLFSVLGVVGQKEMGESESRLGGAHLLLILHTGWTPNGTRGPEKGIFYLFIFF